MRSQTVSVGQDRCIPHEECCFSTTDGYKPLLQEIFSVWEEKLYCYVLQFKHKLDKYSTFISI